MRPAGLRAVPRTAPTRAVFLVVAALVATVCAAVAPVAVPAAWAHSYLVATSPAASATVTEPISEVTLTFNEPVHQRFSAVVVSGPAGASYGDGPVRVVDTTVHQPVRPLRSGSYTVRWRVVSADSHPVEGTFGFTVALPSQREPSAGPSAPDPPRPLVAGVPERPRRWWAWAVGAGGPVVAGSAAVFLLARRRRS
ncbi:copper resistance CopC family protein [Planosporangium sp. 12N6]|uniref:copper resistance CopC family protein n=1 Tax=Planosporangium spinosum TaxID=3402278 RepID=UPI003CE814A9